jgi:hypothetical protein
MIPFGNAHRREQYVEELQKHIIVQVYGSCERQPHFGVVHGTRSHADFSKLMRSGYKFYLAFENTLCIDYFSEKL